jgi:tryptophan synthase alpha chain
MRIAEMWKRKRANGQKAFIAYLTAGDPSLEATTGLVRAAFAGGADLVELGVPHSDPVADGPTNLRSAQRALSAGTNLKGVFALVARLRREGCEGPLVLFTYFNPVLRLGLERFADSAAAAGVDGILVVDLPPEEAGEWVPLLRARGIDSIFLASPTTDPERLGSIGRLSSGFLYYVSRLGVTGTQESLSATLAAELERVRARVAVPIAIGFGISTPEQVAQAAALADGVVVGSALVECVAGGSSPEDAATRLREAVGRLSSVCLDNKEKEVC